MYMIHNFLMSVNPYENLIAEVDRELMDAEADHHIGTSGLPTDVDYRTEFMLREQIASQMWNDYHNNFEFNWANEVTDNNMNSPDPSLHSQGTSSRGSKCKASMMEMLEKQYERLNSGIKRVSKVLERGNAIAEKSLTILESGYPVQSNSSVCSNELQVQQNLMDPNDWRVHLQADSRERIVNKILETLKRHLPFSGEEGLLELKKIAERFEDKIYVSAVSQSDYLRKISLKMLMMETKAEKQCSNLTPGSGGLAANLSRHEVELEVDVSKLF
ncbi:hypothetical protein GH714_033417 [Hevea brasiliensis]|uniref:Mediator complex subunit 15 KIX domain-containing protein n=1 Tax=Hevea brasiliensis TaxID=3981 RepID=A0A6A6NDV2_HEVBR|nr:hypothetical protein GH714_033417 [Hevea brasiliensis]